MNNPYNPSFGKKPNRFLGRDFILESVASSFTNSNSPWRSTLITGIRGSGKSALLTSIAKLAEENNVISVLVSPDQLFLDNILSELYTSLPKDVVEEARKLGKITSVSVLGNSVTRENYQTPKYMESFRPQLIELVELAKKHQKSVIFLIDEVQKITKDVETFISAYQYLISKDYPVLIVMAGLPAVLTSSSENKITTFIRRAYPVELVNISLEVIRDDYLATFGHADKEISFEIAEKMSRLTTGYPYLVQLLGYFLFEKTSPVDEKVLNEAFQESKNLMFSTLQIPVMEDLSQQDRDFLYAMLNSKENAAISTVSETLKKSSSYVAVYRQRLISAGVIKKVKYGVVTFTYPYMAEFLTTFKENYQV